MAIWLWIILIRAAICVPQILNELKKLNGPPALNSQGQAFVDRAKKNMPKPGLYGVQGLE